MVASSFRRAPRVKLLCALVASCFAAEGLANPTGPAVVSGSASFNAVGKNLTVTNSPNAIINWQGFSIGAGEATRFQQQSAASAVLNRVVGQDPSAILGTLSSNGRVFLVNPNGILFGQGSRVDVGGLVASTLNITDSDFLAGRLNFQAGALAGSIVNQGEIVSSSGGRIYLVAPDVQNHGLISSPGGEVLLAAGKTVSLVDADVPNLQVEVQAGGEALNVGQIITQGGKAGIYAGLINQRGIVRADSASKDATGRIVFKASDTTILDAGSVTSAAGAKGGEIQALGNKVGLVGNAQVDASGDAGGGTVLIGGDYQGKNSDVQNAWRTYLAPQSSITADAITSGDGGKVIVWSDDATRAYGTISARGGAQSGNGGFVEVSGKNWLDFNATVDTSASKGSTGVLLLDPAAVSITNTSDSGGSFNSGNPNIFSSGGASTTLTWTTIRNHLTGAGGGSNTNVYVTTSGCSTPGSCGIDILAASGDLASSNMLRLISHESINVGGSVTNTGSGALELYAGWDGVSTASPNLNNLAGSIAVNQPISFAGNVLLRAFQNITDAVGATITTPNLLASSSSGSVNLSNATHMVGTLAGTFGDQFQFKNGQALTIGSVDGTSGISTTASAGGAPSLQVTVTTGNLTVNNPISVSDGGGTTAATSVTLQALNGSISVNNTTVTATAVEDDSNNGQPATVTLNATNGGILISNSTVSANGGQGPGSGDPGGDATVSLNATGGITVGTSTVSATGGAPGFDTISGANGGDASVQLVAGGTINSGASALTATAGTPLLGSLGSPGVGTVLVAVNSTSGNPSPSGDIVVHNITADNVNLQQQSAGSAKSILRASGTSLITAGQLLMEVDDPTNVGGGSIGTSAAPMRVQVAKVEAHTHEASAGIFIESPNAANLQIGGVSFNAGSVKGVQALAGGDIQIAVNGTLTLQTGSPNSPCGVGTGGPICTTSGNVTLRANDMVIGHTVVGTGIVSLAPFSLAGNINIESSPTGGLLSLTPGEIGNVSAGTLEIGRSDGTGTLSVNAALEMGAFGALSLYGGNINVSSNITKSAGADATLSLIAKNSIQTLNGADIASTSSKLNVVLNSDADASGAGRIALDLANEIRSNGGNVTLGGGADPTTGYAVGDGAGGGAQHGVRLNGASIVAGAGNVSIRGRGAAGTTLAEGVRLQNAAVVSTTTGSITLTGIGGAGALGGSNRGIHLIDAGTTISSLDGTISLTGTGGSSTGSSGLDTAGLPTDGNNRGILINDGPVIQTTGLGNIVMTGSGGTSVDRGQNTGVLISQDTALGTRVTTVNGNITITGTGGSTTGAGATIGANRGVSIGSAEIRATGTGAISITGTGGASVNATSTSTNSGVLIQGDPDVAEVFVTTAGGALSITGTAGSTSGTIVAHEGIAIVNDATVQATGGALTLTGTASAGNPAIRIEAVGGSVNPAHARAEGATLTVTANGLLILAGATGTNEFAELVSSGNQSITATGIVLTGGANGTGNYAEIGAGGTQSVTAGASGISITGGSAGSDNFAQIATLGTQTINSTDITLTGGEGTQNFARLIQLGSSGLQTISATGAITMIAGGITSSGSRNYAQIEQRGNALQHVTADSITLEAGGGASGDRNSAVIFTSTGTTASQQVDIGSGGLIMQGGTGSAGQNKAGIWVLADQATDSGTVATQVVNVSGGGSIIIIGGSNALNSPSGINNNAGIYAAATGAGSSQTVTVAGTGGISLIGGASGVSNHANIWSLTPTQTITTGSGGISLLGDGGATGTNDKAFIFQEHAAGSQSITVNGGGSIVAMGGSGSGGQNFGQILNNGSGLQSITFTGAGGVISLHGGTGDILTTASSGNNASIEVAVGNQTITGSNAANRPGILLTGGDSGGNTGGSAALLGNNVFIRASLGSQSISAGVIDLNAGAGGVDNSATIQAPSQVIIASSVAVDGGGNSGSFSGARIGGIGGLTPGATNLSLTSAGDVTLTGGSVSGASIGSNAAGGVSHAITITSTGGSVILNPGGVGARIGSPASNIAGGDISITAASAIALNSSAGVGTAIRTLGNVTLNAPSITQGADSVIISGGLTTLSGGTVSLTSATNQFSTVLLNTTGNVALTDLDAINFGTSTTGSGSLTVNAPGGITQSGPITTGAASFNAGANAITLTNASNDFTGAVNLTGSSASITDANALTLSTSSLGSGSLVVNASGAITQGGPITAGAASFNAGSNPISLTNASNDFTGAVSLTGTTVSIKDANVLTLGAVSATDLNVSAATISQDSSGVVAGGTSTLTAGAVSLNAAANDFGTVAVTSTGNVALADANAITIAASSVGGTFDIVAASTSFLNGFSANNYSFSGGSYTLAAGTYNLGGTTTVASSATVTASGATINAAGGTINVSGTFSVLGGSVTVGTLNVLAGGALTGTGTITGNVNNSAGTVLPGASPGILTINGNYVQGPSGVLGIDIGGTTAGTQYDQLIVSGNASLGGTLSASLIGGFVPPPGSTYTFIQAGGVSGTFSTINQPAGALFNPFYGPTTFEFIAVGGGSAVPAPIEPSFNQSIVSIEQVLDVLLGVGGAVQDVLVGAGVVASTTTTTPEGKIVPKPPACN